MTLEVGQKTEDVKITIDAPYFNGTEFSCKVTISGGDFNIRNTLHGEDSMQAVAIAMSFCKQIITESDAYLSGRLYHGEPGGEWI